jgi:hypothetical protein
MNIVIFLVTSLLTRLLGFLTPAIWYDEAVTYYRASLPWSLYTQDISDVTGPNAWEIFLRPFSHGPVWLLRLPALISAMIALYLAWRIMEHLNFTTYQKYTAAIGMALLPGLLWQAQDARYYAVIAALYLGAIWYALNKRWLGLTACCGLLAWVQPVGAAYGAAALVIALLNRFPVKRLVPIGLVVAAAWVPRYIFLIIRSDQFWLTSVDTSYVLVQTVQALFVNTLPLVGCLVAICGLIILLITSLYRSRSTRDTIIIAAATLPALAMLVVSIYKPVYFYRPIQPLAIPFCMLIGLMISPHARKPLTWIAPAIAGLLLLVSFVRYNPADRGGDLDLAAAVIQRNWQPGDLVVYITPLTAFPFSHYIPDLDHCILDMDIGMNVGPPVIRGYDRCPLSRLSAPGRVWLVWIREPAIAASVHASLEQITAGLIPVARTNAWQFAQIEIYLLDNK